jgi:hypothetical protein
VRDLPAVVGFEDASNNRSIDASSHDNEAAERRLAPTVEAMDVVRGVSSG